MKLRESRMSGSVLCRKQANEPSSFASSWEGFDYNLILMWQHNLHIYGVVLNWRCQFVQGNEALGQTNWTEELVFLMRALVLLLISPICFPKLVHGMLAVLNLMKLIRFCFLSGSAWYSDSMNFLVAYCCFLSGNEVALKPVSRYNRRPKGTSTASYSHSFLKFAHIKHVAPHILISCTFLNQMKQNEHSIL